MIVYVMRHAEAVEESDILQDEWRYLTEKGRKEAKRTSSLLVKHGPKPRLTISSPLARAVQTAEITAEKACRRNVVITSRLLLPGGDITELVAYMRECKDAKRVLLIGHEPQLSGLIANLLGREVGETILRKGACVALNFNPDKEGKVADFLWYQAPGRKLVTSCKKIFPRTKDLKKTAPDNAGAE